MAAINFPNNPNIGDTFAAAGKEWQWDGTSWNLLNVVNSLHAATHESGGSDEVELAQSQIINLTTDLSNKASASSLSNHISATTDVHGISNSASLVYTNDSRLSDSRTPLAHAASHSASGSDAITVAQSQVTDLTTDLSAKAPLASPTFTGTPAAPTATVGTNTTQISTTAYVRAELTYETTTDLTVSANATTMDIATGNVGFVASGPTANWTVNFTNVPAVNGQTITATIFVTQGATGYIPSTVQIGGVGQTIKWQGGSTPTPTSSSGKIDAFSFSMIRRGGTWTVLGSMLGNF